MKKFLLTCILFLFSLGLFAHPHMWFTSEFEFQFLEQKLSGVMVSWKFDKFFSSDIISGYDFNKDGKFDKLETDAVFQNAFTYTRDYNYFTFLRIGEKRITPEYVDRKYFSANQENGVLVYTFFVDLSKYNNEKELYIACYDYTYFCDIKYTDDTVKASNKIAKYEIFENKNYPVYYDPFGSIDDTRVYYKWAPGLSTYYPLEVKVVLK